MTDGIAIVGLAWGDEGKGKVAEILSESSQTAVRFSGTGNAGHVSYISGTRKVFRHLPVASLREGTRSVLTPGVLLDPNVLATELVELQRTSKDNEYMAVGDCPLVMPWHKKIDEVIDLLKGKYTRGTTGTGSIPAYSDFVSRRSVKLSDLKRQDLSSFLRRNAEISSSELPDRFSQVFDIDFQELAGQLQRLLPSLELLRQEDGALEGRKSPIIFEGSKGSLADLHFGTYPNVQSYSTLSGAAIVTSGFPSRNLKHIVGVTKPYLSLFGEGVFPSEIKELPTAERIRVNGDEKGSLTGAPRRIGWLDLAAIRYSIKLQGATHIWLSKLDALTGIDTIRLADSLMAPNKWRGITNFETTYTEFPGWNEDVSQKKNFSDLPRNAQSFVRALEERLEKSVGVISVGPKLEQVIFQDEFLKNFSLAL
jgi:adenylosuccinate synthase